MEVIIMDFWNIGIEFTTIMFCTVLVLLVMMLIFGDELRDLFNKLGN